MNNIIVVLDLSGKIPNGITKGAFKSFGLYDECLDFKHNTTDVGVIEGQFCNVFYKSLDNSSEISNNYGLNWRDL